MAGAVSASETEPMMDINTTPLIDVMLVLLIMFIITIPTMTHSVKLDLPSGPPRTEEPLSHQLDMDAAGRLSWDGAPMVERALGPRLAAFRQARPDGILRFQPDPQTRYEDVDRVLAAVKRARIEGLGFLGNERFAGAIDE